MAFWSRPSVGLDIGTRAVKVVQLKKAKKRIEIETFGIADIYPSGEKPPAVDAQRHSIVQAIKSAMDQAQIKTEEVATAVAGEAIIVRYIQLPDMPEEELKNALRWEAEEYIPFRVEDVNIDSAIIGRSGEGDAGKIDVLLVCARKDLIAAHVDLLKEAGLHPSIVDVDSFAFLNCFDVNYQPNPSDVVGLVNMGGDITSISVYCGGTPRFSRDISIGGSTITTTIQQRLDIPFSEAEALKTQRGAPSSGGNGGGETPDESTLSDVSAGAGVADSIQSAMQSLTGGDAAEEESPEAQADRAIGNSLDNLIGEIRRSIQFFENQSRGLKVQRLVLGGGSVALNGLDTFIQNALSLPVEIIDPLLRIPLGGKNINSDLLRDQRYMLSVGVGLALRKVMD